MNLHLSRPSDQSPFQQNAIGTIGILRFSSVGWIVAVLGGLVLSFGFVPKDPWKVSAASAPTGLLRGANSVAKSATPASLSVGARDQMLRSYGHLPLSFEANRGQSDPQVKFLSHGAGYTLFLTENEAVLAMPDLARNKNPADPSNGSNDAVRNNNGAALRMKLLGANRQATITGVDEVPGKTNYFRGRDPKRWQTNVATYGKVHYQDIYPGVDLIYYGDQGQLEYDFIVGPGADPQAIALNFAGTRKVAIDQHTGDLVLQAGRHEVRFHQPLAYQTGASNDEKHFIDAHYSLTAKKQITFQIAPYDHSKALVIDPTLSYSTYLGGSSNDYGTSIAVDTAGNAYVVGYTNSLTFPVTAGAFQTNCSGGCSGTTVDTFVTKLDPSGSTLLYSTYLGGGGNDYGNAIVVDAAGEAFVVGQTFSSNFPVTSGAFQTACAGGSCASGDAFVTELNSTGSALVYSTYLGGSALTQGNGIALDATGNAYVVGTTQSTDFPTTPGVVQATCNCSAHSDVYVTKLNASGSGLVYSTYLGGTRDDIGYAIALNSATNNVLVTGYTRSTDFPTTPGAFQVLISAPIAAFVTQLNSTASALVYSTYLGGKTTATTPCETCASGIAVDSGGNAYVSGLTAEANFPTTQGAFQTVFKSASNGHDAFVTKLNPAGTALVFSTYIGGTGDDGATGMAVDASGNVWLKGNTKSTDFPVTTGSFQTTSGGNFDTWIAELSSTGSTLLYSTYLGGSGIEFGGATRMLALDNQVPPNVYVTGYTNSTNFPIIPGAFQNTQAGANDVLVSRFTPSPNVALSPSSLNFGNQNVGTTSNPQTVTVTNTGNTDLNVTGVSVTGTNSADFNQTNTCTSAVAPQATCTITVTFTPSISGTETANVTIADNAPNSAQVFSLTGIGIGQGPAVSLSPTSLTFPTTLVRSSSAPQNVTLTNIGNQTLQITSITTSGDFSQTNTCGSSVVAGANCTISVTFKPSKTSTQTAAITITDNAPGSPQTATLTGTGTFVQLSSSSLSFGNVKVGSTSTPQTVTLTNTSVQAMTVKSITVTGTNAKDFSQTNTCGTSVGAGASCSITVTFKPTALGSRTANVSISDTGGGSPQLVTLAGTGT